MDEKYSERLGPAPPPCTAQHANGVAGVRRLSLADTFNFSCHSGLSCFNTCCRDTNIFLTPYDVLRMRKALGTPSGEFLERYTIALLGPEGLPAVVLKMMNDDHKSCPFVTPDGCKIYEDRPWSCRMYPLYPVPSCDEEFSMEEKTSCCAFAKDKQWTIEGWRQDQGIGIYDQMNECYKQVTFHEHFDKGSKLEPGEAQIVYMSCYDLDKFRRFLFETRFFDIYDLKEEFIEELNADDEELLLFGYSWVKFNLFGEATIRIKDKTLNGLLQAKRDELSLMT